MPDLCARWRSRHTGGRRRLAQREFEIRIGLHPTHRGKAFQKPVDSLTRFQIVDQSLYRHARSFPLKTSAPLTISGLGETICWSFM